MVLKHDEMQQHWENKARKRLYFYAGEIFEDYRYRMQLAHLLRLVNFKQVNSVLDLGCNTGRYAVDFAKKCKSVIAIDFSPTYIDYAIKIANDEGIRNITFLCQSVIDYSYLENRSFDLIHIGGSLMYMDDYSVIELLRQLRNHLNQGGLLITRDSVALKQRTYGDSSNPCIYRTDDEYVNLLQTSGFKIIYNNYSMVPPLPYHLYNCLPTLFQKSRFLKSLLSLSLSIFSKVNFILLEQKWFISLFIDPFRGAGYCNRYYFLQ